MVIRPDKRVHRCLFAEVFDRDMHKRDWLRWSFRCIEATPTLRPHPLRLHQTLKCIRADLSVSLNYCRCNAKVALESHLKKKGVGKGYVELFGVSERGSQPMVFQLDRYMHILCDITRLQMLGSGCTMATRECVCVTISLCLLYMSLLIGCSRGSGVY